MDCGCVIDYDPDMCLVAKHWREDTMQNESKKEYYQRLLAEEELILDFSEEVCGRLNELGRDKSWLQKKLGLPPYFLTGADVPDLRRVADIALILGCEVVLKLEPIKEALK